MLKNSKKRIEPTNFERLNKDYLRGTHLDIYGDDYSTEIHAGKLFLHLYNELCFTYGVNTDINVEIFVNELIKKYDLQPDSFLLKYEQSNSDNLSQTDYPNSEYIIRLKDRMLIEAQSHRIVFWYGVQIPFAEIEEVFELISQSEQKKTHARKFYMVASSNHTEFGFYLQEFDVKDFNLDINSNYNDDFEPINEIVNHFLNQENRNGLVILHGKYGTGKTTYIRHLISSINKRFIYLPINLVEAISSPNFLPFISQYKDSILILEDCEDLLTPREQSNFNNPSLVNLLNLGDGLLADALSIKIICTFNSGLKQIDKAILRKGRLIARYEFNELDLIKAQNIANSIGLTEVLTKPTTLAEIYNHSSQDFGDLSSRKVGF